MVELAWETLVLLALVAGVAGFVDALAGGGGLLTIPAMLMANIPPLYTLGTNKLQATAGSFSASVTMIRQGKVNPKYIWQSIVACFVGAMLGTIAVQLSPPELLTKAIPFLIAIIGLYYLFAPKAGEMVCEPR